MSGIWLIVFFVAALVAAAYFWRQREKQLFSDTIEEQAEDTRVTPLLRGINYLLSDKPDQALQEMVQVAKIRSESAEVYMALGEMFRAQGEYGRAVRIHQNLLARPEVSRDFQFQAYVSLGRDFQAGGLLDRALKHYAKALAIQPDHLESLYACLRIREQSHEWDEAEWLASRLEQVEHKSYHEHRAYLKAEMARDAVEQGDVALAESLTIEALKLSPSCTHAHLLRIQQHMRAGDADKAIAQAKLFLQQAKPEHHMLLPGLLMQDKAFYEAHGRALLLEVWETHGDVEVGVAWVEEVAGYAGVEEARVLQKSLGFKDLSLRHELRLVALAEAGDNLVRQAKLWRLSMKLFACKQCGVQVHDMRWQCPKCNAWGSMEPLQGSHIFGEEQHAT